MITAGTSDLKLPETLQTRLRESGRPLRIEILECTGGQGHQSATDAVQRAVQAHFERMNIAVVFQKEDVGTHMAPDPLGKVTFGKYRTIDFYNKLAQHGCLKAIAFLNGVSKVLHTFHFPYSVKYFEKRLLKQETEGTVPDLIISCVPIVNGPVLKAVGKKGIPVMVVTTDADNRLFSINWPKPENQGPYRYCIPYNLYEVAMRVARGVDFSKVRGIGYPVRPEFLKKYSEDERRNFREELGIEEGKKVVNVMMGGLGGVLMKKYFHHLVKGIENGVLQNTESHFSFFCARNDKMRQTLIGSAKKAGFIEDQDFQGEGTRFFHQDIGVAIVFLGYTNNIHKHMAIATCCVTKPGSGSFNECLYMGVPMLIDSQALPWERLNLPIGRTYHFGESVEDVSDWVGQVNRLCDEEIQAKYRLGMREFFQDRPRLQAFADNVVRLTFELLCEAEEARLQEQTSLADRIELAPPKINAKPGFGQWLKGVGQKVAELALKVCKIAFKILLFPLIKINEGLKFIARKIIDYTFFSGFFMNKSLKKRRRQELIEGIRFRKDKGRWISPHKGKPIEGEDTPFYSVESNRPIDALYIRSASEKRTGSAIIYVLGKEYQNFHPRNYDHLLDDGADIVLFNPSENNSRTMASDLKTLIQKLKKQNPDQKLFLHGYCIGAHIAPAVASEIAAGEVEGISSESLPVLVDRGYGNGYKVAKKITFLAKIPYVRSYIEENYSFNVLEKIENHRGEMLFLSPKDGEDQMLHRRRKGKKVKNFTIQLAENHKDGISKLYRMRHADHWTPWTYEVHNRVKRFLKHHGIIRDYTPFNEENTGGFLKETKVPWVRRHLLPVFI